MHGDTDLTVERYRYGFERRTDDGPVAVLPPAWLHTGVTLIRPYLVLEKVARSLFSPLRNGLFNKPLAVTDLEKEKEGLDAQGRTAAMAWWRRLMGPQNAISSGQVDVLRELIEKLLVTGRTVVVVDMPIPDWHRAASPWQPSYASALHDIITSFSGRPNFLPVRTDDLDAEANFTDEVHPKPHLARVLAARVAAVLDPLLCRAPTDARKTSSAASR